MITKIVEALRIEQSDSASNAREMIERIDTHIRNLEGHIQDLETTKIWIMDSAKVRAEAIDGVIGPAEHAQHA